MSLVKLGGSLSIFMNTSILMEDLLTFSRSWEVSGALMNRELKKLFVVSFYGIK